MGRCRRVAGEGMSCVVIRMIFDGQGVYQARLRSHCSINTPGNSYISGNYRLQVKQPGTSSNGDCSSFLTATV